VLEALTRGVGQNLSTNVEFKTRHNIGAGTMQRALDLLRDRGAVVIASHGHLGRQIEQINIGQSWQAAGLSPIRLLLPPAGPVEIDALSSLLADGLTALGVPYTVHHLRGGAGRLAAMQRCECDFAVVSTGTWADAGSKADKPSSTVVRALAPGTYYAPQRLVVVSRKGMRPQDIRVVTIDRDSSDHTALTFGEFPPTGGYEYVDAPFPAVPAWVLRKRADAGIWHQTSSVIPLDLAGIDLRGLKQPASKQAWDALSGVALIGSSERPELRSVIEALDFDSLLEAQQKALAQERDDSLGFL